LIGPRSESLDQPLDKSVTQPTVVFPESSENDVVTGKISPPSGKTIQTTAGALNKISTSIRATGSTKTNSSDSITSGKSGSSNSSSVSSNAGTQIAGQISTSAGLQNSVIGANGTTISGTETFRSSPVNYSSTDVTISAVASGATQMKTTIPQSSLTQVNNLQPTSTTTTRTTTTISLTSTSTTTKTSTTTTTTSTTTRPSCLPYECVKNVCQLLSFAFGV